MGFHATDRSKGDFQITPDGTHLARCYMVIDLGLQETTYKGVKSLKHKCIVGWELPNEPMEDGRPFVISKRYTVSTNKKANLMSDLVSWRGQALTDEERKSFDLFSLLGKPAQVTVTHENVDDKTYANVSGVSRVMKGLEVPDAINPILKFSFEEGIAPSEKIPEWIRKLIDQAVAKSWDDYESISDKSLDEDPKDIPF